MLLVPTNVIVLERSAKDEINVPIALSAFRDKSERRKRTVLLVPTNVIVSERRKRTVLLVPTNVIVSERRKRTVLPVPLLSFY